MALQVIPQTGVLKSQLANEIKLAQANPRYVAHLAVDESDTTSLLIKVMRDASRDATPPAAAATSRATRGVASSGKKPATTRSAKRSTR